MEIVSLIADICGILGFFISLFAIAGVIRINKRINNINISGPTNIQKARGRDNDQRISNR